jgi:glyoxylase-like metal-dependent hydrolase (beta-lactamase superfamily II)
MSVTVDSLALGPVSANTYIVTDDATGETAVIDAGACTDELLDKLNGKNVRYILLTHGHYDHILGVPALKAHTGAEVLIHKADADCFWDTEKSLASFDHSFSQTPMKADRLLSDGEEIHLGETVLSVLHTPGHTKGGVCYIDYQDRLIFSGDTLFCLTAGRTDFPGGSFEELMASLITLRNLPGDYIVYPGHNRATTLEHERVRNRYMRRIGK